MKFSKPFESEKLDGYHQKLKKRIFTFSLVSVSVLIAIAVGLGVGLKRLHDSSSSAAPPFQYSTENATTGSFWQPVVGTTWQIELLYALNDTSVDAEVYDIDLFTTTADDITTLHALGRKVICYFSAGSYEDFRPDANQFNRSDYGKPLKGWPGEYWLNTNSANVRTIMLARLDMAVAKSCDGVDPDNVDGFDNGNTGVKLTEATAVEYLTFLAIEAHNRNLAIGLKNAGKIINQTLPMMQWQINEQCEEYDECDTFQPFIAAGKPVFHIEYPPSAPHVSAATKATICNGTDTEGFSTVIKNMVLDNFVEYC